MPAISPPSDPFVVHVLRAGFNISRCGEIDRLITYVNGWCSDERNIRRIENATEHGWTSGQVKRRIWNVLLEGLLANGILIDGITDVIRGARFIAEDSIRRRSAGWGRGTTYDYAYGADTIALSKNDTGQGHVVWLADVKCEEWDSFPGFMRVLDTIVSTPRDTRYILVWLTRDGERSERIRALMASSVNTKIADTCDESEWQKLGRSGLEAMSNARVHVFDPVRMRSIIQEGDIQTLSAWLKRSLVPSGDASRDELVTHFAGALMADIVEIDDDMNGFRKPPNNGLEAEMLCRYRLNLMALRALMDTGVDLGEDARPLLDAIQRHGVALTSREAERLLRESLGLPDVSVQRLSFDDASERRVAERVVAAAEEACQDTSTAKWEGHFWGRSTVVAAKNEVAISLEMPWRDWRPTMAEHWRELQEFTIHEPAFVTAMDAYRQERRNKPNEDIVDD